MDGSVFVLLLLSGLLRRSSGISRQYYYINTAMSWPEAQSYCRERYTDLATADSMDDVNRLVNVVDAGYSGLVWIGLKRGTQTRWAWSNGENKTSEYFNWAPGEPNEGAYCGCSYFGDWYDTPCSTLRPFTCYKGNTTHVIQTAKTWSDAQSYCRQYYTDLPTIHNSVEDDQITAMLISGRAFWIGLFLDSWEWSDKWSRFFRHWAAGQPSGSGNCVAMSRTDSGRWTQYSCNLRRHFICHGRPVVLEYQFMNRSMTWFDAQSYCRARFTDLAAVTTMNDVNRLVNTVNPGHSGSVWIGLQAVGVKRWVWSTGDISISQENMWHPGEPNGDGECVRSFNGSWYDESCSTVLPFVCFNDSTGFVITKTAVTWRDAQSYCRQHHTDLASINPEQQNLIHHESSLWIGLFLDSWGWSNQWSHFFRHWTADQPSLSSGSSNCTGMSLTDSGKWAQYSCDVRQPFICHGNDDKLIKNQIVRLKFSCTGKCTLNDPSLQTAILNEISKKLKSMGLESDRKLSWRKGPGGQVFQQETKPRVTSNTACNKQ